MSETTSSTAASESTEQASSGSGASKEIAQRNLGRTVIADTVVAKIAGLAAREIGGVYDLGGTSERMVGKVRDVLPGSTTNVMQGIQAEVGDRQAAVDVSIIADYGVAIHQLAAAIRRNVVGAIEGMTGLEVTEVNVAVLDVHLPDAEPDPEQPRRVE